MYGAAPTDGLVSGVERLREAVIGRWQRPKARHALRPTVVVRRHSLALTMTTADGRRVPARRVAQRVSRERLLNLPLLMLPLLAAVLVCPWPALPTHTEPVSVASLEPPLIKSPTPGSTASESLISPPRDPAIPADRSPSPPMRETVFGRSAPLESRGTPALDAPPPLTICPAGRGPLAARDASIITPSHAEPFGLALARAARNQLGELVIYNPKYRSIRYPMGDVGPLYGVCTDVVIRAYRQLGIDLQVLVALAKLGRGDPSIDHRRVEVLRRFFAKAGAALPVTDFAEDYAPGDVVTYARPQGRVSQTHIAIVTDLVAPSGRPMIVHNRGWGPLLEDALFADPITGHYRYRGEPRADPDSPPETAKAGNPAAPSAPFRSVDATPTAVNR